MNERIKDLETIKSIFDKHRVKFILIYGALLGHYRDGDFIEHDDDIDLAVIDPIDFKTRKAIGWDLYNLGFKNQEIAFNVFGNFEHGEEIGYTGTEESGIVVCERNFKFTIFFFKEEFCQEHGYMEYVCTPKQGAIKLISTPAWFFQTFGEMRIGKNKYLTPSPIKDYLQFCYNDWQDKNGRDHSPTYPAAHPNYKYNETT